MHHRFSELILARKKIEICTKLKFISELSCFQCLDEKAWKEVRFSAISLLFRDRCQFNLRTAAYISNCLFLNSNQRAQHLLWSAWIAKTRYSLCQGRIVASRCSERVSGRYLFLSVYIKAWQDSTSRSLLSASLLPVLRWIGLEAMETTGQSWDGN